MPIKNVGFKTSPDTGTRRRESAGQGLAKLIVAGAQTYEKKLDIDRANKAQMDKDQKDVSTMALLEAKSRYAKDHANFTRETPNFNSDQFNGFLESTRGNNEDLLGVMSIEDKHKYDIFHYGKDSATNKMRYDEEVQADSDMVLNSAVSKDGVTSMDEVDEILDMQMHGGISKNDFLGAYSKDVVRRIESGEFAGMKASEMKKHIPLYSEIMNNEIKNPINKAIGVVHDATLKAEFDGDIVNLVSKETVTTSDYKKILNKHSLSVEELFKNIEDKSKFIANTLTQNQATFVDGVKIAVRESVVLKDIENGIENLRNISMVDAEKGFVAFRKASMAIQSGYTPQKNMDFYNQIEGVANQFGINLADSSAFDTVMSIMKDAKESGNKTGSGNGKVTIEHVEDHDLVKDNWIPFDESIEDAGRRDFILSEANKFNIMGDQDKQIEQAIASMKVNYFGTEDGELESDWRGVSSIKTKKDVEFLTEFVDSYGLENPMIKKTGDIYLFTGKYRDGEEMPVMPLKPEDINYIVNFKKEEAKDEQIKRALLDKKIKLQNSNQYKPDGGKYKGLLLLKKISENIPAEDVGERNRAEKAYDFLMNEVKDDYNSMTEGTDDLYTQYINSKEGELERAEHEIKVNGFVSEFYNFMSGQSFMDLSKHIEMSAQKADEASGMNKKEVKAKEAKQSKKDELLNKYKDATKEDYEKTKKTEVQSRVEDLEALKKDGYLDGMVLHLEDSKNGKVRFVTDDSKARESRMYISYDEYMKRYKGTK